MLAPVIVLALVAVAPVLAAERGGGSLPKGASPEWYGLGDVIVSAYTYGNGQTDEGPTR